jgi:protein involved in polysaccharide export with SLBB domain
LKPSRREFVSAYSQGRGLVAQTVGVCRRVVAPALFAVVFAGVAQAQVTAVPAAPAAVPAVPPAYRIGPGDDLAITFPYNAELNHEGPVGPDGRIALPLIGSIPLAGDTVNEAAAVITKALSDGGIVANAYTLVQVAKYGSNVYVGGQVQHPGAVALTADMDPLQAVITAGGLLDGAKTGKVAIIHRNAVNGAKVTYIDLHGYLRGHLAAHTVTLQPYDVVYVPKSAITEVDEWIDNYLNKTLPFSRGLNYSFGNYGTSVVGK